MVKWPQIEKKMKFKKAIQAGDELTGSSVADGLFSFTSRFFGWPLDDEKCFKSSTCKVKVATNKRKGERGSEKFANGDDHHWEDQTCRSHFSP